MQHMVSWENDYCIGLKNTILDSSLQYKNKYKLYFLEFCLILQDSNSSCQLFSQMEMLVFLQICPDKNFIEFFCHMFVLLSYETR